MKKAIATAIRGYTHHYTGLPDHCWPRITLTFVNSLSIGISFFLTLYFVHVLRINISTAGLLISCYSLGTVMGGIISGKLCDRLSPNQVSLFNLLLQATTFLLLLKLTTLPALMSTLLLLGIASYGFKTANNMCLLNECPDSDLRLRVINIAYAASNLGLALSGVIISLQPDYNFHHIFYLSSGFLFSSALFLMFQKSDRLKTSVSRRDTHQTQPNPKILIVVLSCVFAVGLLIAQLNSTYPLYIQDTFQTFGVKAISILFILDTVVIVIFQAPLVSYLSDRNKISNIALSTAFMAASMLVLSLCFNFMLAILSCILWTVGEMLFIAMTQLVCYEQGAEKKKGEALGILQATLAASRVIGPTLGGMIYQVLGGQLLWQLSAMICLGCWGMCVFFKKLDGY